MFPCSPQPSGTWRTPGLSIPYCCLPTSSSVCLVLFPLSLCLARWFWLHLMDESISLQWSVVWSGKPIVLPNRPGRPCGPTSPPLPFLFLCFLIVRCGSFSHCHSRSGELRMQKFKSHLLRAQSLKVLPLKLGLGQYIATHATFTARDFFLSYFYPSGPFTCIFSKTSPKIFLCWLWLAPVPM